MTAPARPAELREWVTVARMLNAWLVGIAATLAICGLLHAVPPWWACWIPFAAGWIAGRVADRLDRRAREAGAR